MKSSPKNSLRSLGDRTLIWGPYKRLKAGVYEFECLIEPLTEELKIRYDIAVDSGRRLLCAGMLSLKRERAPEIQLANRRRRRVSSNFGFMAADEAFETKPFRFLGLRLVRQGVFRAPHQSEAMALLAHLSGIQTAQRLHNRSAVMKHAPTAPVVISPFANERVRQWPVIALSRSDRDHLANAWVPGHHHGHAQPAGRGQRPCPRAPVELGS